MATARPVFAKPASLNMRLLGRGMSAHSSIPHEGGAGGGGAGGRLSAFKGGSNSDPVVSGEYERTAPATLGGFQIGGGGLTPRGEEQKTAGARLQAYTQRMGELTQGGADFQSAFRQLVKENPQALSDFMSHPTALQNVESLTSLLTGSSAPQTVFGGVDKHGQQVEFDPTTGKALGVSHVPGFTTDAPAGKQEVRLDAQGNRIHGTTSGGVFTPGTTASGAPDVDKTQVASNLGVKMAGQGGPGDPDANPYGVQAGTNAKAAFPAKIMGQLSTAPNVYDALQTIRNNIDQVGGLGREPVAVLAARFAGTNPAARAVDQSVSVLKQYAAQLAGSAYKGNVQNWLDAMETGQHAPAFVKQQMGLAQDDLRRTIQATVDTASGRSGRVPQTVENNLEKMGVIANGYQTPAYLDKMDPTVAAIWKVQNGFGTPKDAALAARAAMAAPDRQPPSVLSAARPILQGYVKQQGAAQEQQAATQAAQNANAAARQPQAQPTRPETPAAAGQNAAAPAPGDAEMVAHEAAAEPQAQGQQAPPGATQGANGTGGTGVTIPQLEGGAANAAPQQPLMPPQAQPGQPAGMVPTAPGTQPVIPSVNPLPGVQQTLTPDGNVPNPATQTPYVQQTPTSIPGNPLPNAAEQR